MQLRRIKPSDVAIIRRECGRFILESEGHPLVKDLPRSYDDFKKVKVRLKKCVHNTKLNQVFGEALGVDLYKTTLLARGDNGVESDNPEFEPFYIFPVDKYQFVYSSEVCDVAKSYGNLIDTLTEKMPEREAEAIIKDLLKFTYNRSDLAEGIRSGAEIVFFGLPKYYALRKSLITSYERFYEVVKRKIHDL
jgi:hypothetical protein